MEAQIHLNLFASLKPHLPENPEKYSVVAGTPIGTVLKELGIPIDEAKLIFVNGIKKDATYRLQGGERVGVFPPVGGG